MSGASEARQVLIRRASALYGAMRSAATSYGETHAKLLATIELEDAMEATVALIHAAEDLADIAEEAKKTMRDALEMVMVDTGCHKTEQGSAWLSKKPVFVDVVDAKIVPAQYKVARDPVLDKDSIMTDLKAGLLVDGCLLVRPNSFRLNVSKKGHTT